MGPTITRPGSRRRVLTILASVSVTGILAGCLGGGPSDGSDGDASGGDRDDSPDGNSDEISKEVKEKSEQALRSKEAVGRTLKSAFEQAQDENWEGCLTETNEVPEQIDTARQDAQEALQLAENGGHTDLAEALRVLIEIIDLSEEAQPELAAYCKAGRDEDHEEASERWDNLQSLNDEIEQKQNDLDQLAEEIDG